MSDQKLLKKIKDWFGDLFFFIKFLFKPMEEIELEEKRLERSITKLKKELKTIKEEKKCLE